jgi:site-specific DNA-methyltransferase (adenine-specific)
VKSATDVAVTNSMKILTRGQQTDGFRTTGAITVCVAPVVESVTVRIDCHVTVNYCKLMSYSLAYGNLNNIIAITLMKLINGDCIEKMKEIPDNSIDIVIADLPYGRFRHLDWDKPINLNEMWDQLNRICKMTTPVFLFGDMSFAAELINSNPKHFKYEIVWNKQKSTTPLLSQKRLGKATEYILIFYRKQCIYNYAKYHKKNKRAKLYLNGSFVGAKQVKRETYEYEPSLPINVIKELMPARKYQGRGGEQMWVPRLPLNIIEYSKGGLHRKHKVIKSITEKPQAILEFLLKYFSNEGDLCLDFVMGSGSCGLACTTLGRRFIGIELKKEHFDKATERLIPQKNLGNNTCQFTKIMPKTVN